MYCQGIPGQITAGKRWAGPIHEPGMKALPESDTATTRPDAIKSRKAPAIGMPGRTSTCPDTQHEEPTAKTGGSPFVRTLYLLEREVLIVPVKVPECES